MTKKVRFRFQFFYLILNFINLKRYRKLIFMDTISKVLSKSSVSWTDVQKNLKVAIQARNFSVNKLLVKQCTDLLVKHIKSKHCVFFWF
jgi:hypothetical protein